MNIKISNYNQESSVTLSTPISVSISDLLRDHGFGMQCCGNAKCGKCRIIADTVPTKEEKNLLSQKDLDKGIRLACHTMTKDHLQIQLLEHLPMTVVTTFNYKNYTFSPLVEKIKIKVPLPELEDQRDDLKRIMQLAKCKDHTLCIEQLIALSKYIHNQSENFELFVLRQNQTLLGISENSSHLALCVDIGTTTIAANLLDINTNKVLLSLGEANAQSSFGSDVISRINQTIEETAPDFEKNIAKLQEIAVNQINFLKTKLLKETQQEVDDVDFITITGNTTMMHFLCGMPAKNISRAPFIPVCTDAMRIPAKNIAINSNAIVFLMPGISSYVGADIVASLLAVNAYSNKESFLLLDLGTNAEIVLGHKGKFIACSAAAGPCFEGASLHNGMAGQAGAVNHVFLTKNGFEYTTINNEKPKGICGSGVLDIVALLLNTNTIDETGSLDTEPSHLAKYIITFENGQKAFRVCDDIYFTQKDIREVQLAKAAIRAGIHTLLDYAGLDICEIKHLYIAGGFGSAMSAESAAKIGLIPNELLPYTDTIGNGASFGVIKYASEENVTDHVNYIIENCTYLELSTMPLFTALYVEQMIF